MTSPINNASFFADPQALASLKQDAKTQDPTALKEAAKQFESLFTQMLLKSMREANKSFGGDSLFGSDQADFYQDMFDDQMALHLSKGKGLGLADMLIRQLAGGVSATGVNSEQRTVNGGAPIGASSGYGLQPTAYEPEQLPQPPASSPQPLSHSKADFVRKFLPHAEAAARELGVDAHALLAQAALETGWGRSLPHKVNGACSYNFFGIKATGRWSGDTVSVPTIEFEGGLPVRKAERFRAYGSPADSFRDYAALIRNNPRYEQALGCGNDVTSFATALQEGGYATDPNYAKKIVSVAREVRALTADTQLKQAANAPTDGAGGRS
jgi:flagellar protein FlgJ